MTRLGLTQQKFADSLGVSRSFISMVLAGKSGVSSLFLTSLATKYGVTPAFLNFGVEPMFDERVKGLMAPLEGPGPIPPTPAEAKTFAERLQAMLYRSPKTGAEIIKQVGIDEKTMRDFVEGRAVPKIAVATKLGEALMVDPLWLLHGIEDVPTRGGAPITANVTFITTPLTRRSTRENPVFYLLPLISGAAAAGPPAAIVEDEIEDFIPSIKHSDWCPHPTKTVCLRVAGESMLPTIPDGGLVAIDLAQRDPEQLVGKICAFRYDDGVGIKRLVRAKNVWIARPDNASSGEIATFKDDEIAAALIGRVVWWWGRE